jgi:hypothetical protein
MGLEKLLRSAWLGAMISIGCVAEISNPPGGRAGSDHAGASSTGAGSSAGGSSTAAGGSTTGGAAGAGGGGAGRPMDGGITEGGSTVVPPPPLDCGPIGVALVNAGPPKNRVNYVILADGYTSTTVNTTLMAHVDEAMAERFTAELGQPYLRYKNFVNICLFKTVSATDGIGSGATLFSCTGDDVSRLADCDTRTAQQVLTANTPAGMNVSWHSIVLNGKRWWNTGGSWMLWSGGHPDGPKAALHEGGHGFHQLADEYCAKATGAGCGPNGGGPNGMEFEEVNSTGNGTTSTGKWPKWLGTTQKGLASPDRGATGLQGLFVGSEYVDVGQYRPSANSKMNSLFGNDLDTSFNAVSREKIVMDIWRFVTPIDSTTPAAGAVSNATTLTVNVIDPAVIAVDWSIDGAVQVTNGGTTLDLASRPLVSGSHTIEAKAYDNATKDLVLQVPGNAWGRMNWTRSVETVTWTVAVP